MQNSRNPHLVFLIPGSVYRADLPNFKDRFELLSDCAHGVVIQGISRVEFKRYRMGNFILHGKVLRSKQWFPKISLMRHMIKTVIQEHKKSPVDIIICYDAMFTGFVGLLLKLLIGAKLVVEVNSAEIGGAVIEHYGDTMAHRLKALISKWISLFTLNCADGIKVLTEASIKEIPKKFHKKQIFIFHDFVSTHYFLEEKSNQEKNILFVGSPFYLKGVDVLIKAFHNLAEKFPEYRLTLIGHEIEKNAKDRFSDLSPNIQFYPGVFYDELKKFFLNCYCFVLASKTEGLPRVIIEAMASGKPVIATRVGGIPALISDGINGFLIDPGDSGQLTRRLNALLSDPELAKRMGEEGRKIVQEKFSSRKYSENFVKMINAVMAGR